MAASGDKSLCCGEREPRLFPWAIGDRGFDLPARTERSLDLKADLRNSPVTIESPNAA